MVCYMGRPQFSGHTSAYAGENSYLGRKEITLHRRKKSVVPIDEKLRMMFIATGSCYDLKQYATTEMLEYLLLLFCPHVYPA